MSIGYQAYCKVTSVDDTHVYYGYSGRDLNNPSHDREYEFAYDGTFAIEKSVIERVYTSIMSEKTA
jgi:hypothetical protein